MGVMRSTAVNWGIAAPADVRSVDSHLPVTAKYVETPLHPVYAFFESAKTVETPTGTVLLSCLECKVAAEEGINALIADRNKQSAAVQQFACHKLLPSNFTDGCDDFLSLYLPTVLYMTWEQFTPEGLCTKMKSCDSVSLSRMAELPKSDAKSLSCQHCSALQSFFATMTERQEFAGLQHFVTVELKRTVCDRVGVLGTACDRLVEGVVPRVLSKFSDLSKSGEYCAKIHPSC